MLLYGLFLKTVVVTRTEDTVVEYGALWAMRWTKIGKPTFANSFYMIFYYSKHFYEIQNFKFLGRVVFEILDIKFKNS